MRPGGGGRDVLHDHVDVDLRARERLEDPGRLTDLVGHPDDGDLGLAPVVRDAGDDGLFHGVPFLGAGGVDDPGALLLGEGRTHVHGHPVAAGVLDAPQVQDLGAAGRHLQHLLVRHPVELAGGRHDPRVGGEDAVDVAVDLADLGAQRGGQRDRGGVGRAAAERGDVLGVLGDALEARDDRDGAVGERLLDAAGRDVDDLGPAVGRVGDDARLGAGEGPRLVAELGDRHRQQRHRDPLTGGEQHVELARRRQRRHLLGEVAQLVGGVPHRRDDDHDVVPGLAGADDALGDALDPGGIGHRGAAVLLHDDAHRGLTVGSRWRSSTIGVLGKPRV